MTAISLHENMLTHLIYTHGRALADVSARSYEDLKAEHDGLQCPPRPAGHAAQARSYSATAAAATRRARRDAGTAAEGYCQARSAARTARFLTRHPELWRPATLQTPDHLEHTARVHTAWADTWLRASFRNTANAAFYRDLAARYRQMHARQLARMAA